MHMTLYLAFISIISVVYILYLKECSLLVFPAAVLSDAIIGTHINNAVVWEKFYFSMYVTDTPMRVGRRVYPSAFLPCTPPTE